MSPRETSRSATSSSVPEAGAVQARLLYRDQFATIDQYVDILASRGIDWGLVGPREVDRLWDRHILNSTALHQLIPQGATLVDVGSGAGLPGIPLALLRRDVTLTLIEPLLRRFNFLTRTVDELGITDRVSVVRTRAEDHNGTYDVVTARALAPLSRLISWCAPLRRSDGMILALKGSSAVEEVQAAGNQLTRHKLRAEVLSVRATAQSDPTTVVRLSTV